MGLTEGLLLQDRKVLGMGADSSAVPELAAESTLGWLTITLETTAS
jgi:hypothetical protein